MSRTVTNSGTTSSRSSTTITDRLYDFGAPGHDQNPSIREFRTLALLRRRPLRRMRLRFVTPWLRVARLPSYLLRAA